MIKKLIILVLVLTASVITEAEIIPGQAVSWSDFSRITCIAVGQQFAYFGTTEGILRYQRFEHKWYDPITISDGLGNSVISRLAVTFDDERIAAETEGGVYTYENGLKQWFFGDEFPFEDYRDSRPSTPLPLVFMPFGYSMKTTGYFEDNFFRDYQITAWLDDYFNSIFVGTWGIGPVRVDSRDLQGELIPCGLLQKQTDAIYIEGDSLWLGGNAGDRAPEYANARQGVTLYDRSRQIFEYFESRYLDGFDSEVIYDIAGDKDNLYFAGRQGLTIKHRRDNYYVTLARRDGLPEDETTALAVSGDSVWVGTSRGLALYLSSHDTVLIVGRNVVGERFITDLELAGGKLFIGTDRGAYYIDMTTQKIGRLKDPNRNLSGLIHHIIHCGDDLLISTEYGLTRIDLKTTKAVLVPFSDGPGGVYAAAANDLYIAAVVDNGLMLIERKTGRKRVFTELDGLLSININAIVPEGDYLWLGSDRGLTRFQWVNPERVD